MDTKFLLSIRQHEGVYFQHYTESHHSEIFQDFLFNLSHAVFIYFNPGQEGMKKEIRFVLEAGNGEFGLHFSGAGMGEYNLYKRQIEEFVIADMSEKTKIKVVK